MRFADVIESFVGSLMLLPLSIVALVQPYLGSVIVCVALFEHAYRRGIAVGFLELRLRPAMR